MKENTGDEIEIILIGNKLDISESRTVTTEEGQALADSENI